MLQEEMVGTEINTEVEVAEKEDKRVFTNDAGEEISMSQFIRDQFNIHNLSRKEISERFDINYRTVYGATVNMTNDAEPTSRGRGVVNPKIKVTAENEVVIAKNIDGVDTFYINGEEVESIEGLELHEVDRNEWIKEAVAAGMSRGDVAKALDLSYGVVYGITKGNETGRQKYEVELPDGTKMGRSEYIRKRVAEGVSKADVAKELDVDYSVVWQATKKDKTNAEKFEAAIDALAKLADIVENKDAFAEALELIKATIVVIDESAQEVTE